MDFSLLFPPPREKAPRVPRLPSSCPWAASSSCSGAFSRSTLQCSWPEGYGKGRESSSGWDRAAWHLGRNQPRRRLGRWFYFRGESRGGGPRGTPLPASSCTNPNRKNRSSSRQSLRFKKALGYHLYLSENIKPSAFSSPVFASAAVGRRRLGQPRAGGDPRGSGARDELQRGSGRLRHTPVVPRGATGRTPPEKKNK